MVTEKWNAIGVWWTCVVVLSLICSGCGPGQWLGPTVTSTPPPTTPAPRAPLSASDVKALAAEFEKTVNRQDKAWSSHDLEALRQLYTDDIVNYDGYARFVGIEEEIAMAKGMWALYPQMGSRQGDSYIGREDGVSMSQIWNWGGLTPEKPGVEYDLLRTRAGRISYWRLWYSPDTLAAIDTDMVDRKLLASYGAAWSSGSPQAVAALYASNAVREDTLFG
jgi:hypothetical protein